MVARAHERFQFRAFDVHFYKVNRLNRLVRQNVVESLQGDVFGFDRVLDFIKDVKAR